jgi:hypothetical protein
MSGRNSFGPSRCSSKPWLSADGPNRPLGSIAVLNLPPVIRLVLIVEVADVRDVVMISGPLDRLILGFERRQDMIGAVLDNIVINRRSFRFPLRSGLDKHVSHFVLQSARIGNSMRAGSVPATSTKALETKGRFRHRLFNPRIAVPTRSGETTSRLAAPRPRPLTAGPFLCAGTNPMRRGLGAASLANVAKKSWHYLAPIGTMLLRIGCLTRFNYPVGL